MAEDHKVIDVEALATALKGKMSGKLTMPQTCGIFRIPAILFRHSPNAYVPSLFSFGPFHHHKHSLNRTEKIKAKYLLDLISRSPNSIEPDTVLKILTQSITNVWEEARGCYTGPIDMNAAKFVEVLVLDGCFIVEVLRKNSYNVLVGQDDPIFSMSCFLQFLWHDMILLENQLPWMVLEKLFDITKTSIDEKPLIQLAIEFFSNMFSVKPPSIESLVSDLHNSKHILDLLRNALIVPSYAKNHKSSQGDGPMPSAMTLVESGIKFKENNSKSILDVKFNKKKGVLEIPTLFIQETTQTVLRNLIALEQCCPNYDTLITSYAVLMDNLINTREDMEILCKSKAVTTWLNVDEAAKFFDKLYIDTYVKETSYCQLIKDVNEYCKRPWLGYLRVLKRDYFSHPWTLLYVLASSVTLLLAFLQTLFAIIKK